MSDTVAERKQARVAGQATVSANKAADTLGLIPGAGGSVLSTIKKDAQMAAVKPKKKTFTSKRPELEGREFATYQAMADAEDALAKKK
jgi:hypothetical protein